MADPLSSAGWNIQPPCMVEPGQREGHVRACSEFAASLLDQHPHWRSGLDDGGPPESCTLHERIGRHGLDRGLRRFRNRTMLGIIWRDLCGLAPLSRTFHDLGALAELCLEAAMKEHYGALREKHGTPCGRGGNPVQMFVIGLGKFGGGELNLSSDIDIIFCFPENGECDGRRSLSNERFFTRMARAVIASLSEINEDGFCFRVDTRLRPFGNSGPLVSTLAALEQYYQREGRDWERYALIKARPVAGDLEAGARFIRDVRPFVYRRYIDYSAVEALQEMHAGVQEDARRKDRTDDIKRGPGGIREIEFLVQCFQILRGGREPGLQTPSLHLALQEIDTLGLVDPETTGDLRGDYACLRFVENRIQALRDQQTHRLPDGEDRDRIARAMGLNGSEALENRLESVRKRVSARFHGIFPKQNKDALPGHWTDRWRRVLLEGDVDERDPLSRFAGRLRRLALSQRADQRLNRFMPALMKEMARRDMAPDEAARVFDLVLAICRRSAYLLLLEQNDKALMRMLDLFSASARVAEQVIRFPALLDELIDPLLGTQIPGRHELSESVKRILSTGLDTESQLNALNYLKLATELRVSVGQLQQGMDVSLAQETLSNLAAALLQGVLAIARSEVERRHGRFHKTEDPCAGGLAIIGYGSLGAAELSYGSDLDIVFLFEDGTTESDGKRPLAPEHYYARLAQRLLSFLTVMTPSGKLYDVDTRLRPNGRAGSLVSSIRAFVSYQQNEAWTWEFQALTRARFLAGSPALGEQFKRVRKHVLCRTRNEDELAGDLRDMRRKIAANQGDQGSGAKHRKGGLIDIEFLAQLGILSRAQACPDITDTTETGEQLQRLADIGWLTAAEFDTLSSSLVQLRRHRMMQALSDRFCEPAPDTGAAAKLFREKLERPRRED